MGYVFGWIVLCIVIGVLGNDRKIGFAGAFFSSLLLSPLVGFFIVFASPTLESLEHNEKVVELLSKEGETGTKECPMCAETIKFKAKLCRYCGYEFSKEELKSQENVRKLDDLRKLKNQISNVWKCPVCGTEVEEGEINCISCGYKKRRTEPRWDDLKEM